jgi:hypothetical protein
MWSRGPEQARNEGTIMNDALGMYLVIQAEHATRLAEIAERERRRNYPRASPAPAPRRPAFGRWIAWVRRSTTPHPAANAAR